MPAVVGHVKVKAPALGLQVEWFGLWLFGHTIMSFYPVKIFLS